MPVYDAFTNPDLENSKPSDFVENDQRQPIRRALISVYDKTGLVELAKALVQAGIELVSTGSTAAHIEQAGIKVTSVEEVTGFPQCFDGRVKTLHPNIHGAILADRRLQDHRRQLENLQIQPFELVVCNLYPFAQTVESKASYQECIEKIDIGGPSMVRGAAKNHANLAVIVSPEDYEDLVKAVNSGGFTLAQRKALAAKAFHHTATYDAQIDAWFSEQMAQSEPLTQDEQLAGTQVEAAHPQETELEESFNWNLRAVQPLRYGENPHQKAAVVVDKETNQKNQQAVDSFAVNAAIEVGSLNVQNACSDPSFAPAPGIVNAIQLHGKAMSYNNYTDGDAAWRAAWDHTQPCVAIIKHANPCGIAVAEGIEQAHLLAHACDPLSAFGGVIAVNRPVSAQLAKQIEPIFTEVLLAPSYEPQALEILSKKKNLRVLRMSPVVDSSEPQFKQISGGWLVQTPDLINVPGDDCANWQLVAGEPGDEQTMDDLLFAWRCVRSVKSNAVLLAKGGATVGVGMGQVNRVDSCKLAVERANTLGQNSQGSQQRCVGSVAASDAFFPFADGPELLIEAGVKAIVQPGGSIRDEQSIELCQSKGVTMYFTGVRHFFH